MLSRELGIPGCQYERQRSQALIRGNCSNFHLNSGYNQYGHGHTVLEFLIDRLL